VRIIDGRFPEAQLQDIIDVAPDRKTAKGRFRYIMQAGSPETQPDGPGMLPPQPWPETDVLPFHCALPVTGKMWAPGRLRDG
jgi:hypothetical protein